MESWRKEYITNIDEYAELLQQCLDAVEDVKQKVTGDVAVFKGGKRELWVRAKAAGKKVDLEVHNADLNAAVGRLQVAQNNLQRYDHLFDFLKPEL